MAGKKQATKSSGGVKVRCNLCGEEKILREYFSSNKGEYAVSPYHGKAPFCKNCLKKFLYDEYGQIKKENFIDALIKLDKPMIPELYSKVIMNGKDPLSTYVSQLNLKVDWMSLTYSDSSKFQEVAETQINQSNLNQNKETEIKITEEDLKAKKDCIRLLGYDPFLTEPEKDKVKLYNTLIDYLDESTLEDSFKIPTVIQIVKSFNQIDKVDSALATYTSDVNNVISNASAIKTLFDSKKGMLQAILGMAKDNGISVNHSNNKSKGAGTLSGIMKKLQELGFEEVDVNLFDIETCNGISQVSSISSQNIMKQLMFDENDYTEMIQEQRIIIEEKEEKLAKLEEENRQLKIKINNLIKGNE